MVIGGSLFFGINYALKIYKRRENLKSLERILIYLESEIRYSHSIISEAFLNAAKKSDEPFKTWLFYLGKRLNDTAFDDIKKDNDFKFLNSVSDSYRQVENNFFDIWKDSLIFLSFSTCLLDEDLEELANIGQTLGYLDIEAHKMGLRLEIDNFHKKIIDYNSDLKEKMKVSVISGAVIGILVVIVLV